MSWVAWNDVTEVWEILPFDYGDQRIQIPLPNSLVQRTDQAAPLWQAAGYCRSLDLTSILSWVNSVEFYAILMRDGTAGTAKVRLYDVTHAVAITGTELTTTGGPIDLVSAALTIGNNPGNFRNDESTQYRVDIEITGGVIAADFVSIYDAGLVLHP